MAIANYLFARHNGGRFLLRIEDTDAARSDPALVEPILSSLKWLGLNWDEDIVYQSQRLDLYRQKAGIYSKADPVTAVFVLLSS